jgi:hypothetical protein
MCSRKPIALHIVPEGRNTAAGLPSNSATRSHSALTVGSSPRCSSPTSAAAIAARIASTGRVWVSEYRLTSIIATPYFGPRGSVSATSASLMAIPRLVPLVCLSSRAMRLIPVPARVASPAAVTLL